MGAMAADSADKAVSLEDIRWRIDAIDSEILRLVDERSGLATQVAAAKRAALAPGEAQPFGLRPVREAEIMRTLLGKPREHASDALIVRLWRDLMGDNLTRQGRFRIAFCPGADPARMMDLTRLRFGGAPHILSCPKAADAVANARTTGTVAVLPLSEPGGWGRLLAEPKVRVFAALPDLAQLGPPYALAAAVVAVEPTGRDETFWATDAGGPAERVIETLARDGVAASLLTEGGGLRLFSLAGFYQSDDPRLARAPGALSGVIGAAPTALDL
jgi:chorismate mutase